MSGESKMDFVLAPFFGVLIGLALGLLGGGGSILTVPILVYFLGQDAQAAVATSLAIVGANAIIGTVMHGRAGHVDVRQALIFGGAGMLGAYLSATLAKYLNISDELLLVLFALLMLIVGGLMLRPVKVSPEDEEEPCEGCQGFARLWRTLATGLGVGVLTGFLGVGGGFLIVPALVLVLGMPMADAVGTSLLIIVLNAVAGLAGYFPLEGLDLTLTGIFIVAGIGGLALGTHWSKIWPTKRLRSTFAGMVVALALVLLVINVPPLLSGVHV
jgi:hypothetical protein